MVITEVLASTKSNLKQPVTFLFNSVLLQLQSSGGATGPVGKVLTRPFFDAMVSAMFASLNRTL